MYWKEKLTKKNERTELQLCDDAKIYLSSAPTIQAHCMWRMRKVRHMHVLLPWSLLNHGYQNGHSHDIQMIDKNNVT